MDQVLLQKDQRDRKIMSSQKALSELKRNTFIIALANVGSKAIAFILAPLYSYYLSTSQYGKMDVIITTTSLLVPFFCLDIFEATFRYSSDKEYDKEKVLSSSLAFCLPGILISVIVFLVSYFYLPDYKYVIYTGAFILLGSVTNILSQYARGNNDMRTFAATGIVNSVTLLLANIVFLILLNRELEGWLLSFLLARFVTVVYLIFKCNAIKSFRIRYIEKEYIKTFFGFCVPLIPTAVMWWIMNASDRYMITGFIGSSANGIYSVANKLPVILSVFETVFYQAWQITAISTLEDENRDEFYSKVFNKYISFLTVGVLILLLAGRSIIIYIFASDYSEAWMCLAPLVVSVLVHALAGNLGSLYVVFKSTKGVLASTLAGAGVNVALNFFLIPRYGIMGAAVATLIGYTVTLIYRWIDVKRFVSLKLDNTAVVESLILIVVQFLLYYYNNPISYTVRLIIVLYFVYKNRKMLLKLIKRGG